jgi:hypothetical protein
LEFQAAAGIDIALQKASAMLFYTIARGDGKFNLGTNLKGNPYQLAGVTHGLH